MGCWAKDLFHFDPILDSLEKQRLLNGDLVNRAKFVIADWLVEKEGRVPGPELWLRPALWKDGSSESCF